MPDGSFMRVDTGLGFGAGLVGITSGPDGNLWFTEGSRGRVGRVSPAGGPIVEYVVGGQPDHITTGPDGNLWVTIGQGMFARVSTSGAVRIFRALAPIAQPSAIVAGPDGNLWFTDFVLGVVGRMTPQGEVALFGRDVLGGPRYITAGPDGNLWFTDQGASAAIGRITIGAEAIPSIGITGLAMIAALIAILGMWRVRGNSRARGWRIASTRASY
jgi:virginiamycin B lyase